MSSAQGTNGDADVPFMAPRAVPAQSRGHISDLCLNYEQIHSLCPHQTEVRAGKGNNEKELNVKGSFCLKLCSGPQRRDVEQRQTSSEMSVW